MNLLRPTLTALLVAAGPILAQTTLAIPCARDNSLYEHPGGTLSNGQGVGLFVGRTIQTANDRRRALLMFDVASAVPAGAEILDARLEVEVSVGSAGLMLGHRVTQDWGEGTSNATTGGGGGGGGGAPATPGDVTWVHTFYPGSTWNQPGGDFVANPSFTMNALGLGPVSSAPGTGLLADVRLWHQSPSQNFGILLKTDETTNGTAKRLYSREATTGQPTLVVTFIQNGEKATYGEGCWVFITPFAHDWSGPPIGGTTVQLTQSNGPGSQLAANLLALSFDLNGTPLVPGCELYLPFGGLIVNHSIFTLDAAGTGATPMALPAGFPGVRFVSQTAALSPANPAGFILSNAVVARLQ